MTCPCRGTRTNPHITCYQPLCVNRMSSTRSMVHRQNWKDITTWEYGFAQCKNLSPDWHLSYLDPIWRIKSVNSVGTDQVTMRFYSPTQMWQKKCCSWSSHLHQIRLHIHLLFSPPLCRTCAFIATKTAQNWVAETHKPAKTLFILFSFRLYICGQTLNLPFGPPYTGVAVQFRARKQTEMTVDTVYKTTYTSRPEARRPPSLATL